MPGRRWSRTGSEVGSIMVVMNLNPPFDRITVEAGKCGGKPCIRGMRIAVRRVLEIMATHRDRDEIFREYPFLEEEDLHVSPIRVKGLAELSLVGVAAAVANAVYHATGKRVRDLPITPEKLL